MYKDESGTWQLIEPNDYKTRHGVFSLYAPGPENYIPYFVFNRDHLWGVYNQTNKKDLEKVDCFSAYLNDTVGNTFDPSFGGKAHRYIVLEALKGIKEKFVESLSEDMKEELIGIEINSDPIQYICRLAIKVIAVDITLNYDALAHFDNSQIENGVKQLERNLQEGTIKGLARGLHGLQDFYAHSSFGHFAKIVSDDRIELANIHVKGSDIADTSMLEIPVYDGSGPRPFDFTPFDYNKVLCVDSAGNEIPRNQVIDFWKGKLISGRYGQRKDSHGFLEHFQYVDENLPNIQMAAGVPHHEHIAMDKENKTNMLYKIESDYNKQFQCRVDAAIRHTRQIVEEWMEARKNGIASK